MYTVLHLGLSYVCNMKCKHCFVVKNKDCLQKEQIFRILDDLCDKGLMFLYYTYGEPLLAKDFFEVSSYAGSKDLVQILMTNGSCISEKTIKKIKENKIANVYVSLDSSQEKIHDANRGVRGAYKLARRAIHMLKEQGINVGISTAVTPQNVNQLKEIYEIALSENVKIISFLRARENNTVIPLKEEEKKAYIDFVLFGIKQTKVNLKFHDFELLPFLKKWYEAGKISEDIYEKYYFMSCCHASTTLSIAPDGNVSNCNLINNKIANIGNTPLNKLWENIENENNVCCFTISEQSS